MTDHSPDHAERTREVAAGLHASDRAALLGDPKKVTGSIATLLALTLNDLAECRRDGSIYLNDRGLAVRASLHDDTVRGEGA